MSSEKEQLEQAVRELAELRALIRATLSQVVVPYDEDQPGAWEEGYNDAVHEFRQALLREVEPPSRRQAMIDHTADMIGLERGGNCTGHLGVLWDAAYKEGQAHALTPGPLL